MSEEEIYTAEARGKAARCAAFLDVNTPGWRECVDRDKLDIGDEKHCIMRYAAGGYAKGLKRFKLSDRDASQFALRADDDCEPLSSATQERLLTAVWHELLDGMIAVPEPLAA